MSWLVPVVFCLSGLTHGIQSSEVQNLTQESHVTESAPVDRDNWRVNFDPREDGKKDWFESPPLLPISIASSEYIRDPKCRNQSRLFLQQLRNYTLWAVQMFDAAVKLPVGALAGNTYQMGHYDECVEVAVNAGEWSGGDLKGQYCLADIKVDSSRPYKGDPYTVTYDPMSHAWDKMKYGNDPSKVARDLLHWALCVPESCSPEEINLVLKQELKKIGDSYGIYLTSTVTSRQCHTLKSTEPMTVGDIIYLSLLVFLISLVSISTWYDFTFTGKLPQKDGETGLKLPSKVERLLMCFSARINIKKLFHKNPVHPAIDASHGPRFLFMLFIIMGHRMTAFGGHPIFNAETEERLFRNVEGMILANGPIIVDGFFALSGVMLSYPLLVHLTKAEGMNLAMPILVRFVRLTPSYLMLIFFHATLLPRMGSGPFWDNIVGLEQTRCQKNWWTNVLYINNYVNVGDMCMFQSWYVAADFHLYIISMLVVYCIWRWRRLGYMLLGILTALSIIVPFILIYQTQAEPLFYPYPDYLHDIRDSWYFQTMYVATHNRAAPYFIGVIIGVVLFNLRNNTYKLGKFTSHIAYLACSWGFGIAIILSAYVFFIPGRPYSAIEAALYGSLHRVGFGLAIAAFFVTITCGQADVHQRFLSWKPFIVLSRLTYGAYLAHTMGQLYDQGSLRQPRYLSGYTGIWYTLGDFTFAFSISLVLLLLIEAPFRSLEKIVFGKT